LIAQATPKFNSKQQHNTIIMAEVVLTRLGSSTRTNNHHLTMIMNTVGGDRGRDVNDRRSRHHQSSSSSSSLPGGLAHMKNKNKKKQGDRKTKDTVVDDNNTGTRRHHRRRHHQRRSRSTTGRSSGSRSGSSSNNKKTTATMKNKKKTATESTTTSSSYSSPGNGAVTTTTRTRTTRRKMDGFTSVLTQPFPYWNSLEELFGDFMTDEWNPAQRSCIIGSLLRFFELKIILGEYTTNQLLAPTQLIAHAWHVLLLEKQTYKSVLFYIQDFHAVRPHRLLHHAVVRKHEFKEYEVRLERTQRLFETYYGPGVRMPATLQEIPQQKQFLEDIAAAGGNAAVETSFWGDISGSTTEHNRSGFGSSKSPAAIAAANAAVAGAGIWCGTGGCYGSNAASSPDAVAVAESPNEGREGRRQRPRQVTPTSSSADPMDIVVVEDDDGINVNGHPAANSSLPRKNNNKFSHYLFSPCIPAFDCFESLRTDFWCVKNNIDGGVCFENEEIVVGDENVSILTPPDVDVDDDDDDDNYDYADV
jgi:hypothetical protein